MDVYVQVACIMARVQHCTFVVQKRQINILAKQEYQYSEVILHRLIIITEIVLSYTVQTVNSGEFHEYFAVKYRQIEERAAEVARYIVNNNATVR